MGFQFLLVDFIWKSPAFAHQLVSTRPQVTLRATKEFYQQLTSSLDLSGIGISTASARSP